MDKNERAYVKDKNELEKVERNNWYKAIEKGICTELNIDFDFLMLKLWLVNTKVLYMLFWKDYVQKFWNIYLTFYAQALVCKHKSIVCVFFKKILGSKVLEEFLIEEEQVWWYVNELVHYINETL